MFTRFIKMIKKKKKKIGVITYFGNSNFGVNMQAYSIIYYLEKISDNISLELLRISEDGKTDILMPYNNGINIKFYLKDYVRIKKYYKFWKELRFSKERMYVKDYEAAMSFINEQDYDYIVVGSDTVLEFKENTV